MSVATFRRLEARAIDSYSLGTADLGIFRILYATVILLSVVPVAAFVPESPQAFFYPPVGIAACFTSTPTTTVIIALNLLLALFTAQLLVGWRTRIASLGTGLTLLVLESWAYSLGKISHDILQVITPLVLAFSDWGGAFSIDALRRRRGANPEKAVAWPLALLALLIGFAMFTSGWAKANSGWFSPGLPCTYGHMIHNTLSVGRDPWFAATAIRFQSLWFWKLTDWNVVAFELAVLPAAIHRRSFTAILGVATLFHLGVMLVIGISFPANVLAYGAFVRFSELPGFHRLNPGARPSFKVWSLVFASALVLGSLAACGGTSLARALHIPFDRVVVWMGAAVTVLCLIDSLRSSATQQRVSRGDDESPAFTS